MATVQLIEDRWCPACQQPFRALVVIRTSGGAGHRTKETSCPRCRDAAGRFITLPARR